MVLFLREGQRGFIDPETGEIRLARVLIPIDGSVGSAAAVARARTVIDAVAGSVEKRLLHIGAAPPAYAPKDLPLTIAQGPVAETILATAKKLDVDVIVMPTAGRRGMFGAFRDSVSAQILDDARFPVLSVPVSA
jgi:nucleotide-binding universal stress UspA family protein